MIAEIDGSSTAKSRTGELSELVFRVLQEGHQGNKGLSAFQLLHRNHENGLRNFPAFAVFLAEELIGFGSVSDFQVRRIPFQGFAASVGDVAQQN